MSTLFSIFMLIFIVWLTLKIVPAILGFTFSLLLVILQIVGVLLLLPVIGLFCFVLEILFILLLVKLLNIFA